MAHRILLVDDDQTFRAVAALALESAGYLVTEAEDAFTALDLLHREQPDVIISDLNMPLMDGRALCSRVRAAPEWAEIPFVILSAYIETDGSHDQLDAPADLYFSKQDSFSCLFPKIEGLIARKKC